MQIAGVQRVLAQVVSRQLLFSSKPMLKGGKMQGPSALKALNMLISCININIIETEKAIVYNHAL